MTGFLVPIARGIEHCLRADEWVPIYEHENKGKSIMHQTLARPPLGIRSKPVAPNACG